MNLFAQFDELLNPEVIAKIAVYVDEPVEKTRKAVQGLVYTVVGGLIKRITSEIGINQLALQIQRGRYEGQLIAQLPTLFREPTQVNATITAGNDAISHLLPALKSSIAGMITSYAGIRNSSAISLLGLTTALVLDELGRQMRERKLDPDGLAASLFEQREPLLNVVPETLMPQLTEKLSLQPLFSGLSAPARRGTVVAAPGRPVTAPVAAPTPAFVQDTDDTDSNGLIKWGVGALVVATLAGGYFVWQNTQKPTNPTQQTSDIEALPTDSINADTVARSLAVPQDPQPAVTVPSATTAVTAISTPLSGSAVADGSLASKLTLYLNDPATIKGRLFPLSTVNFQYGTIVLNPASEATITELVNVLKTHPTTQIRLIAYANDAAGSGLTNKALSFKRVNILKQQLVSAGINYVRVDAVGVGTGVTPPKASDSTAVRKPPMRKIDMRVVVK